MRIVIGFLAIAVMISLVGCGTKNAKTTKAPKTSANKIAWYAMVVHPYFDQVKQGAVAFGKDSGVEVETQIGQEATQDNESANVEALAARGFKAFSIYPADASGANGLYEELTGRGCYVVSFGAPTKTPTTASFCVATDVKAAAMQATEALIKFMGGKGKILDVLELVEDPNTVLRREGIEEVVKKHPGVTIAQTVAGMTSVEESTTKIQDALAGQINNIDGIIATGYTPTVAVSTILAERNAKPGNKKIHFVGIDTDKVVLKAIKDGYVDATISQNPYGHGYISCSLLKHLQDGWKPKKGAYFINAGTVLVTKDNVDTYPSEVKAQTTKILGDLETKYLDPPK